MIHGFSGLSRKILERFLIRLVNAGLRLLFGRFFLYRLYRGLLLRDCPVFRHP